MVLCGGAGLAAHLQAKPTGGDPCHRHPVMGSLPTALLGRLHFPDKNRQDKQEDTNTGKNIKAWEVLRYI
jgi:hypothetical protein